MAVEEGAGLAEEVEDFVLGHGKIGSGVPRRLSVWLCGKMPLLLFRRSRMRGWLRGV